MKRICFIAGFCVLLGVAASALGWAKDFTPEEMVTFGGKRIKATITWAGTYNFFIHGEDGKDLEILYEDGKTQFVPEDYRPSVNDVADIVYFTPYNASGSDLKNHAMYIGKFEPANDNEIPSGEWLDAVVSYPRFRGAHTVYLPKYKKLIAVEGSLRGTRYGGFEEGEALTGDAILIKIKSVPQHPGASNVFVVTTMKFKED